MLIIYSVVIIIFLAMNKYIYKKFWNYLNVFLLIWYFASVLSMQGFYDFYVPSNKAYIYIDNINFSRNFFNLIYETNDKEEKSKFK